MNSVLPQYHVDAPTWFYLSLLLITAVYFRFDRVWSLRNFDLLLLLCVSPGVLLAVSEHQWHESPWSFALLLAATALILIRLLGDGLLHRRPRLDQNLNAAGTTFLAVASFGFLMTEVVTEPPPAMAVKTVQAAENLLQRRDSYSSQMSGEPNPADEVQTGPANTVVAAPIKLATDMVLSSNGSAGESIHYEYVAARILAILAHSAILLGLLFVGHCHFSDVRLGLSMALLYLLLPCTAIEVGKVHHVLPAAFIIWAVAAYRRPVLSGGLLGFACGSLVFPVFLVPTWTAFYGRKQGLRFVVALALVGAALMGSLVFTAADTNSWRQQILGSIDWRVLRFDTGSAAGFWSAHDEWYRLPVLVAFLVLVVALTIWPRQKNLEHLLAHSAAIVVATQFWYPQQGGVYLLWYVPLFLLVAFRPRLSQLYPTADALATVVQPGHQSVPRPQLTLGSTRNGPMFR